MPSGLGEVATGVNHASRRREATLLRETLTNDLKTAMKAGEKRRVDTIRLVNAALKDKDIEARGLGKSVVDEDILALLQKMIKSRQESLGIYEGAGREDLALVEREEIAIIGTYLPQQMSEDAVRDAIRAAIVETGAASVKDMGKVIAALKSKFAGQMDFGKASGLVRDFLK